MTCFDYSNFWNSLLSKCWPIFVCSLYNFCKRFRNSLPKIQILKLIYKAKQGKTGRRSEFHFTGAESILHLSKWKVLHFCSNSGIMRQKCFNQKSYKLEERAAKDSKTEWLKSSSLFFQKPTRGAGIVPIILECQLG